jgi:hypothetical protein
MKGAARESSAYETICPFEVSRTEVELVIPIYV